MYFEITKNKKEEFTLTLRDKKGEPMFKVGALADKPSAKKLATKIRDLTPETEIRDLSVPPKVDKQSGKNAPSAKKPATKKPKPTSDDSEEM